MRRRKKPANRPTGASTQTIDIPGCPYRYLKPWLQAGKWRCRRRARADGAVTTITLPDATSLGEAIQDVTKRAEHEAREAAQAALPPEKKDLQPITLKAGWDAWMAFTRGASGIRASTAADYESTGSRILDALGEDRDAHTVTLLDVETLILGLEKHAARTKLKYLELMDRLFAYLLKHHHVEMNPVAGFDVPKSWRREIKTRLRETGRALTLEEIGKLVKAASTAYRVDCTPIAKRETREKKKTTKKNPHAGILTAIALSLLAGLRKGNIVGPAAVTWRDIDLEEGKETITIDADRMKGRERLHVPLNAELAEHLRERRRACRKTSGRVVDLEDFKHTWEGVLARSKIEGHVRYHDLRHTAGSLLGAVAPAFVVAKVLGHAGAEGASTVTANYVHVAGDPVRIYLNQLPRLLSSGSGEKISRGGLA